MKKIVKNKQLKYDNIIKAAQKVFQNKGFLGSNMDEIAKKAKVTKQTIYRYFPSKEELFNITLENQRINSKDNFIDELKIPDSKKALENFAIGFIKKHLSKKHISNIRLIISEGHKVPQITKNFYAFGPEKTKQQLSSFIKERFNIDNAEFEILVFISTLISMRTPVLTGLAEIPCEEKIISHAKKTVNVLMNLIEIKQKELIQ